MASGLEIAFGPARHGCQGKREQNPTTARKRSSDETSKYALKCAIAGNLTKACKIVCTEMTPACSDDTVHKLRDLHPERSLDLNLDNLPTPESLNAFWDSEEGIALKHKWFNVKKGSEIFSQLPSAWCSRYRWLARVRTRSLFELFVHEQ